MNHPRHFSKSDEFCIQLDLVMRTVFGRAKTTDRLNPAAETVEPVLTMEQRKHAAALMRINHAGEVCAQALYQAQGIVSRNKEVQKQMAQAAIEEGDHLAWCSQRLFELGSHTSYLNPVWYAGSFVLGLAAGLVGDKWSLGFVAETETQVVKHLENHLTSLPLEDQKSFKILHQMREDEAIHRDAALSAGGEMLPPFIKKLMGFTSKVMVKMSYWI